MPPICIVVGCSKKFGDVGKGRRKVSFFRLPTDPTILLKWCDILSININHLSVTKSERVCSEHFSTSDITYLDGTASLAAGALPINSNKSGTYSFVEGFCTIIS
jgi:hypothetical protein